MEDQLNLFEATPKPVVLTRAGRRRRFTRTPDFRPENSRAGRLQLTQRDLDLIAMTARLRFMSTHQACMLFGCACPRKFEGNKTSRPAPVIEHRPECACTCGAKGPRAHAPDCPGRFYRDDLHLAGRLRELYQTYGYLDRPVTQLQLRVRDGIVNPGSVSTVYSVTKAGLEQLSEAERESLYRGKLSFVMKSDGGRMFMDHQLRIGDLQVALSVGLRDRRDLVRLSEAELRAGLSKKRLEQQFPFSLRTKHKGKKLTAVCDLPFALKSVDTGKVRLVMTEVDLGHMPVMRKGTAQTSLVRKVMTYAQAYAQKTIQTELGFAPVTFLFLTTSEARVASCVKMCQEVFATAPNMGRLFLFGTHAATRDLFNATFTDGRGRPVKLVD